MREDEYLGVVLPQALLERTARWGAKCFLCNRRTPADVGPCPYCGGMSKFAPPTELQLRLIASASGQFLRDDLDLDAAFDAPEGANRVAAMKAIQAVTKRSRQVHPVRLAASLPGRAAAAVKRMALLAERGGPVAVKRACKTVLRQFRERDEEEVERLVAEDRRQVCDLIRDVLGNPYRRFAIRPAWLDANRKLARTIAAEIAATGRYREVPVLADALEDAGCDDAFLLEHARKPRHCRGCWLIGAIAGVA